MNRIEEVFPEGKRKAFTISYDDGVKQDEKLLNLMKQYKIRGTFNINTGLLGRKAHAVIDGVDSDISTFEESEISKLYQEQEIACHTLTHKDLTAISAIEIRQEVVQDREKLERLVGKSVKGFAYPFGTYNEAVIKELKSCGIHYARTVESTKTFQIPKDFLKWKPTCHHNDENVMHLLEKFCTEKEKLEKIELFYLWGHSYEFDQKNNWSQIENIFKYISNYQEQIYFGTNEEIYQCLKK